jgi:hypothetical protein
MAPSRYFLRQCFVGAEEEPGLPHVVAQLGGDNIDRELGWWELRTKSRPGTYPK